MLACARTPLPPGNYLPHHVHTPRHLLGTLAAVNSVAACELSSGTSSGCKCQVMLNPAAPRAREQTIFDATVGLHVFFAAQHSDSHRSNILTQTFVELLGDKNFTSLFQINDERSRRKNV